MLLLKPVSWILVITREIKDPVKNSARKSGNVQSLAHFHSSIA